MSQTTGKGWDAFVQEAPSRVVKVIEEGPFPLKEYGSSKLTHRDKKMGIMRYKGERSMKQGMAAVVYFDPDFCQGEYVPIEIPDEVIERHSEKNVRAEFKKI